MECEVQHWQSTLAKDVSLTGPGVHSGRQTTLTLRPAEPNTGILFCKKGGAFLPAHVSKLAGTELAVTLGDDNGFRVSTVEHVMAALRGLQIDNAVVELDGEEAPILDGSALPYVAAMEGSGIVQQSAPRRVIEVLKPVRIDNGTQWAELLPYDGFRLDIDIDFDHPAVGRQRLVFDQDKQNFKNEIAGARTFGFFRDAERLRAAGFGLGASLANTVVLGEKAVMNQEGLRFTDEFVRHKALDAMGDLALAGLPLRAEYRSYRGGHKMNAGILSALFIDRAAYRVVELGAAVARPARVPAGLKLAEPTFTPSV